METTEVIDSEKDDERLPSLGITHHTDSDNSQCAISAAVS